MRNVYKVRVLFDQEGNCFRDFEILESQNFEIFHESIKQAFNISGEEMASFYVSNDEWDKGEEIPLVDIQMHEETEPLVEMRNAIIGDYIMTFDQKFVYVYDFLKMWCFYVEVIDEVEEEEGKKYPNMFYSLGDVPKFTENRENLTFEGKQSSQAGIDEFDDFNDDEFSSDFESLDDLGEEYL